MTDFESNELPLESLAQHFSTLSNRQKSLLDAILAFIQEMGYPPSIKQLCERCGLSSTSTVHHHLSTLKQKGLIDWNPTEKRSLNVHPWVSEQYSEQYAEAHVANSSEAVSKKPVSPLPVRLPSRSEYSVVSAPFVPLLGTIAAGSPLQTTADDVEQVTLHDTFCPPGCYALRVKGYSMIEDHIMDGDIVIVNPTARVRDGDVAVALVEGETATLKRIYRENNGYRLQPANSDMEPIFATDVQIQGKLESVMRKVT